MAFLNNQIMEEEMMDILERLERRGDFPVETIKAEEGNVGKRCGEMGEF